MEPDIVVEKAAVSLAESSRILDPEKDIATC